MISATAPSIPRPRAEASALFGRTMGLVAATAGSFAVGAYIGRDTSGAWTFLWYLVGFALLLGLNAAVQRSAEGGVALLLAFGLAFGLALAPTLAYYAGADPKALWQSGVATALFVAGFGAAGYAARRDLSPLARLFFWALVVLIGFGVVLVFVQIPGGALVYAIAGLVIFAGLTAFDFQRLRRTKDIQSAPILAASIFLDILNVFLLLLSIFDGDD